MSVTLGLAATGPRMPLIGLGTWHLEKESTAETVKAALRIGYRHIDCASDYGNEKEVGKGLAEGMKELGIKREEIWVTTKLCNTMHKAEHVRQACELQLKDLRLSYLDMYLIHFPVPMEYRGKDERSGPTTDDEDQTKLAKVPLHETWRAMESLVDEGLVRTIGVSNFAPQLLLDLLTYCRFRPVVNQVEVHPYFIQERMLRFCDSNNIHVTAYSPLASGSESYKEAGSVPDDFKSVLETDEVKSVAAKHKATPAQVVLKWGIQRGCSVLIKSDKPDRLKENFDCMTIELDAEDIEKIASLNRNIRLNDPLIYWGVDVWGYGRLPPVGTQAKSTK